MSFDSRDRSRRPKGRDDHQSFKTIHESLEFLVSSVISLFEQNSDLQSRNDRFKPFTSTIGILLTFAFKK
jgi:hypothetical protein